MAKKMKRILAMCLVLMLTIGMIATPAMAKGNNSSSTEKEWYQVIVNGSTVASKSGPAGNHGWLVSGVYKYSVKISGTTMSWTIGKQTGKADISDYITIPDGFEVAEGGYTVTSTSVKGTNSQSANYDNAIVTVTITALYNPVTQETISVTEPPATEPPATEPPATEPPATEPPATEPPATEPPATEPPLVETKVKVNHIYNVFDVYTGLTTEEGRTSSADDVTEGDSYTAQPVATYGGNTYVRQTGDDALTITIVADASANVIDIIYQRTIDTTPVNYNPVVKVEKTADKAVYEAGETITWTITVTNTSEYSAYDVAVVDDLTGDIWMIGVLGAGETRTFTATMVNAVPGSVKNVVVVSWDDNDEIPDEEEPNEIKETSDEEIVSVNDPIPENYTPVLSVSKTADKEVYKEGETITWTITVKNVSEYPAYGITVVDALAKGYWTIDVLNGGEEKSFTVTMENVAPGSVKNTVVVSWDDGDEIPDDEEDEVTEITDEEIVTVEELIDYAPILSITKKAKKSTYKVGQTIKWTITVKNIGDDTAYDVVVVDDLTGDEWYIEALEPGAQKSFTATMKNAKAGTVKNVAVVTWDDGDEVPNEEETDEVRSDSDKETVKVEKRVDPIVTPDEAEATKPTEKDDPAGQNDEVEIPDEDVPMGSAPKTGDISTLWIALSGISAAGMIVLGKKREDDEE